MGESVGTVDLIAEFTALPEVHTAVDRMIRNLAHMVRGEAGNLRFDVFQRIDDPQTYVVVETYQDRDAFADHLNAEHTRRFNHELKALVEGGASRLIGLVAVDGQGPR